MQIHIFPCVFCSDVLRIIIIHNYLYAKVNQALYVAYDGLQLLPQHHIAFMYTL